MIKKSKGFTLIELLIVVAIIAILAAIAIPNFLLAQTRSKVSKVYAEMRTCATALESYMVDYNRYPLNSQSFLSEGIDGGLRNGVDHLGDAAVPSVVGIQLTTPISYITSLPNDPFVYYRTDLHLGYWYGSTMRYPPDGTGVYWYGVSPTQHRTVYWQLASNGPDRDFNEDWRVSSDWPAGNWLEYDPTNGTVSDGNITRISGNTPGLGYF